jgi:hypothetical protein
MRFNPDCIRDILLTVERISTPAIPFTYSYKSNYPLLSKYSKDELIFHVKQCEMSGLFTKIYYHFDCFDIFDLSPLGHEMLAKIRLNKYWEFVKKNIPKAAAFTAAELIKFIFNPAP